MNTPMATLIHTKDRTADHVYRLGEFGPYREAEQVVDRLTDVGFPVERVRVVHAGLYGAEQAGRLTVGRATLVGAGLGAWLGLIAGVVVALFLAGAPWLTLLLGGLLIGAAIGAVLGVLTYWATDWRDALPGATRRPKKAYAVEVDRTHAAAAVQALDRS